MGSAEFRHYHEKPDGSGSVPTEDRSKRILIYGGANVAPGAGLETPRGVATLISMPQLEQLLRSSVFETKVKAGFLKVEGGEVHSRDIESSVKADLQPQDSSAPLTDANMNPNQGGAKTAIEDSAPKTQRL